MQPDTESRGILIARELEARVRELEQRVGMLTELDEWLAKVRTQPLRAGISAGVSLEDLDGDTKVQVEESADEDKIRMDTGGTERAVLDSTALALVVPLKADALQEKTSAGGVTLDLLTLIKDGKITPHTTYGDAYFSASSASTVLGLAANDYFIYALATNTWSLILDSGWRLKVLPTAAEFNVPLAMNSNNLTGVGTIGSAAITSSAEVTGTTIEATGDTSAGDNSALGYTSTEGAILTGQGSSSDVTIKNDADATIMDVATGTIIAAFKSDVTVAGTVLPAGDTAAGDNSALGYTATEGAILTGQGSTSDVTIKNDADATVVSIPTGTTEAVFAGHINIDSTPGDDTVSGITAEFTAGTNLVWGNFCYIGADGKMEKALATAEATSRVVAFCTETISENSTGTFLLHGFIRDDSAYNFTTIGAKIYLSDDTAGALDLTQPAGTDETVVILGIALTADVLYFNPTAQAIVEHV